MIKNNKHRAIRQSIQTTLKRELMENDEFMLICNGVIYKSHLAWEKIFSLSGPPIKYFSYISKFKVGMFLFEKIYKIVSKYRKIIYRRKGGCNC